MLACFLLDRDLCADKPEITLKKAMKLGDIAAELGCSAADLIGLNKDTYALCGVDLAAVLASGGSLRKTSKLFVPVDIAKAVIELCTVWWRWVDLVDDQTPSEAAENLAVDPKLLVNDWNLQKYGRFGPDSKMKENTRLYFPPVCAFATEAAFHEGKSDWYIDGDSGEVIVAEAIVSSEGWPNATLF